MSPLQSDVPQTLDAWLTFAEGQHSREIAMGLERTRAVAERLEVRDVPGRFDYIIAGTNGKGSTTVALEALLLAQGATVGATLSPHVHVFNERVRLNGENASDECLCAAFRRVNEARGEIPLTYFEFAALVALEVFRQEAVEVAVLEVGLGGRLDAFNVVDADVAVVTSIGLDHQAFLGDDVEQIGREKAGVFRPGKPVVLGAVTESVRAQARELDCRVVELGAQVEVELRAGDWDYAGPAVAFDGLPAGALAPSNWALALSAAALRATPTRAQVEEAIARAWLPGRLERHVVAGRELLLDVAHNGAGAEFLATELERRYPGKRFLAVLGMLEDKDSAAVVRMLEAKVARWLTVPTEGARALSAAALEARLREAGQPSSGALGAAASFEEGLSGAVSSGADVDGILVLGSFSVVEQARNWLRTRSTATT